VNVRSATAQVTQSRLGRSPATELFLWSRLGTWAATLLAYAWFDPHRRGRGWGTDLWARWDSGWFTAIAQHGYASAEGTAAFFPGYPGAVAVVGRALGGHYVLAGVVVSLASCLVAFELLWRLAEPRLGREGAWRTVLYLAVFPTALFLQAVYSESLYLAFALAAFLAAERGRWAWAGLAAAGALLTRSTGVAVVAGLAVLAWPSARKLAWLALAPAAFALFPLLLWREVGDPWVFLKTQGQLWDRHLSPAGPLGGLWEGVAALGRTPHDFTHRHALAVNAESLAFCVLFLALLPLVWRRFGRAWFTFAAVSLALPLSYPGKDFPLLSLPRFGLVVFPFFLALAAIGARPRAHAAILVASALLLGVAVVQWATFQWVA
jgi:hypothetical protein